jgi:flotillin
MNPSRWVLISLGLLVSPLVLAMAQVRVAAAAQLLLTLCGLVGLSVSMAALAFLRLYVRAKANEAFVRTGSGGARVILDGGCLVVPFLHAVVRVPLETMRLDVDRTGADALITADKLRADLKAEFYIRVQPNRDDVLDAARSLGEKTFNLRSIEELVKDKLISTLRAIAATRTLDELNAKREEFAAETKRAVEADLRHNGLTLETVTVSKLDQTDPKLLNPHNVFDAQGLRRIAEITQAALVERNRIERDAEQARCAKDVATREQVLKLEQQRAEAEAAQAAQVTKVKAERQAQAQKAQIEQAQGVAEREVERQRSVEQAQLVAQEQLTVARRQRDLVEIERVKSLELAEREKRAQVALAEVRRAQADQRRLEAEAERMEREQRVKTVEVRAQAERDGEQKLIATQKAAEEERYRKQVDADVAAYAIQRAAEAKKAAAEAEFQAKTRQAQADAEAARMRAEGETAVQMVEVNVARRGVEVEAARVEVEQRRVEVQAVSLSNQEKYGKAALDFELGKLRIAAGKDTQVATARALGEFLAKANFTLFGDAESAQKMMRAYLQGMGLGRSVEGFLAGMDGKLDGVAAEAGDGLVRLARAAAERLGGAGAAGGSPAGGSGATVDGRPQAEGRES